MTWHRTLHRQPAGLVAKANLFKISQKQRAQSSSQSERTGIPATRCSGSIGHLFLCTLFFGCLFFDSRARARAHGEACARSLRLKPKKAPARFLDRVAKMYLFQEGRGYSWPFVHIAHAPNYQPLLNAKSLLLSNVARFSYAEQAPGTFEKHFRKNIFGFR